MVMSQIVVWGGGSKALIIVVLRPEVNTGMQRNAQNNNKKIKIALRSSMQMYWLLVAMQCNKN